MRVRLICEDDKAEITGVPYEDFVNAFLTSGKVNALRKFHYCGSHIHYRDEPHTEECGSEIRSKDGSLLIATKRRPLDSFKRDGADVADTFTDLGKKMHDKRQPPRDDRVFPTS